jgi:hypothetical protein
MSTSLNRVLAISPGYGNTSEKGGNDRSPSGSDAGESRQSANERTAKTGFFSPLSLKQVRLATARALAASDPLPRALGLYSRKDTPLVGDSLKADNAGNGKGEVD